MATSKTGIQWCDRTWNPTRGCRRISPGCGGARGEGGCYAEKQAARFCGPGQPYEGLVTVGKQGPRWTGATRFVEKALREPISWRKPQKIFVDSMSDLFFEGFTDEQIARVFAIMVLAHWHTFQVLTKRAMRMLQWFCRPLCEAQVRHHAAVMEGQIFGKLEGRPRWTWPLPNLWIGFSAEDQHHFDERWAAIEEIPATVLMVSMEPLLGPITLPADFLERGQRVWPVLGGESGPGARPGDLAWFRSPVRQCQEAGVPVFVKQLGAKRVDCAKCGNRGEVAGTYHMGHTEWLTCSACGGDSRQLCDRKGGNPDEWPEELSAAEEERQ